MSLLLPEGTRVLHIGPAKTGTTGLQGAFHAARPSLADHGVHYAGTGRQPRAAAGAIATGGRIPGHRTGAEAWPRLVAEVAGSTAARVVISSETFARADDAGARTVIDAFGADRTHVVITMRPLADMLPSSWQQYVQTGSTATWPEWLEDMLRSGDTVHGEQPEFWRKTRIDVLAKRWSALVGQERVTVLSLAGGPRDLVLRTFEDLTGLPPGTLQPRPDADNASLGFGAAEAIRRFNELFADLPGATDDVQAAMVEFGAVRHLRRSGAPLGTDRIELPHWAAERAAEVVGEMTAGVREAGVRVIGDLDALAVPSRPTVEAVQEPDRVDTDTAARLLVGMMLAAGKGMPVFPEPRKPKPLPTVAGTTSADLLRIVARRAVRRARGR